MWQWRGCEAWGVHSGVGDAQRRPMVCSLGRAQERPHSHCLPTFSHLPPPHHFISAVAPAPTLAVAWGPAILLSGQAGPGPTQCPRARAEPPQSKQWGDAGSRGGGTVGRGDGPRQSNRHNGVGQVMGKQAPQQQVEGWTGGRGAGTGMGGGRAGVWSLAPRCCFPNHVGEGDKFEMTPTNS